MIGGAPARREGRAVPGCRRSSAPSRARRRRRGSVSASRTCHCPDRHAGGQTNLRRGDGERTPGRYVRVGGPRARVRVTQPLPEPRGESGRDVGVLLGHVARLARVRRRGRTARPGRASATQRRLSRKRTFQSALRMPCGMTTCGRQRLAARHGDQVDAVEPRCPAAARRRGGRARSAPRRHARRTHRCAPGHAARGVEDERHAPENVTPRAAVAEALRLLEELLAVVGGHDDHHGVEPAGGEGDRRADQGGDRRSGGCRRRGRRDTRDRGRAARGRVTRASHRRRTARVVSGTSSKKPRASGLRSYGECMSIRWTYRK